MACVNGISIKKMKKFRGRGGTELYQGDLYLGKTKIGFWSEDFGGGPEEVSLLPGYSITKLIDAISSLRPEDDNSELSFEFIMHDLLLLHVIETEYKRLIRKYDKKTVIGILATTDNCNYVVWPIFKEDENKDVFELMKKELQMAQEDFYKDEEITNKYYSSVSDFTVGEPIDLKTIEN